MTDLLKDALETSADRARLADLDLTAALAAGRARLRRRRLLVGGSVAAVALGIATAVPLGIATLDPDGGGRAGIAGQVGAFAERKVTYAVGSQIHYGADAISVAPHEVHAFVQNDRGFAFASTDGGVYFADGDEVTRIGDVEVEGHEQRLLTADDSGSLVGWVDLTGDAVASYRVYDAATGETQTLEAPTDATGEFESPTIQALDGSDAYILGDDGVSRWDLDSGDTTVVKAGVDDNWLAGAQRGWLAFDDSAPPGEDEGMAWGDDLVISQDATATGPRFPSGAVVLSPEATYFSTDHDDTNRIIARDGGGDVTPDYGDYGFFSLTQWIDDDEFVAIGVPSVEGGTLDLLTCTVGETCEVADADVDPAQLQFPIGVSVSFE